MNEEKLLGHVISKENYSIDPRRIEAISKLMIPLNKKKLQSFLGQINFFRRFIQYFVEIIKAITKLIKDQIPFEWITKIFVAFEKIKLAIIIVHILKIPYFLKEFIMYAYGVERSVVVILTEKEDNHDEHPITIFQLDSTRC